MTVRARGRGPGLVDAMIARRVTIVRWTEALVREPGDIKVVVDLAG